MTLLTYQAHNTLSSNKNSLPLYGKPSFFTMMHESYRDDMHSVARLVKLIVTRTIGKIFSNFYSFISGMTL